MLYRLLGMAVWKGARFYLRRRYGARVPSRTLAALGAVLVLAVGAAVLAARRGGDRSA